MEEDNASTKTLERHPILHMASFSRSGETLMLRCLDAHPDIHVVHQITKPEPPQNKSLFRLLRGYKKKTISAASSRIQAAHVTNGATLVLKNATWTHPWEFNGFVLVRNPLSVVNSLSSRNPDIPRWTKRIAPSLEEALIDKPKFEKIALLYEAKMLPLATCGLPIVRYEDFVRQPEIILKNLLARLKIPWDDSVLRSHERYPKGRKGHGNIPLWKPIHAESLNSWKNLPAETIESVLRINAKSMAAFGYEWRDGDLFLREQVQNVSRYGEQSLFQKLKNIAGYRSRSPR